MRAMTEIEWLDGRVTKVPELALGDAFGESVQAELDFGFDNVLEGLWVEVRHHEPDEDSDGDPRGRGCALYADCRYSLVEPSDLDRVFCILYEGQPRVCRVAGELVNLSRACALSCLMLGSPCPPGALEALAACARYLCGPAFTSDLAARARAAGELGPPCVGTSFRASTASGLWHSPPGPPVPPGRRVSRLWQDDCTYICAFPVWEYVSAYAARGYTRSALHRYTLHAYGATRRRRTNGGRADHGRPRAMLPFLREVPSGPPESRLHLQALFRNWASRLGIPGLRRGTPSAFPRTHCAIVKRRARASASRKPVPHLRNREDRVEST